MDFITRFWKKVDKNGPIMAKMTTPCWMWLGAKRYSGGKCAGYGKVLVNGKLKSSHRVSFELAFGPIPEGMDICHKCNNRPCVNPDHFYLGTNAQNTKDAWTDELISGLKGENNGRAILDWNKVMEIRHRAKAEKITYKQLATQYNIGIWQIARIVQGRQWKV